MKPLHGIPEYVVTDHKNTSQAALTISVSNIH